MIGNWNYGTGRRKSSVARDIKKKGSGQNLFNAKPVESTSAEITPAQCAARTMIAVCKTIMVVC